MRPAIRRFRAAAVAALLLAAAGCSGSGAPEADTVAVDAGQMLVFESDSLLFDIRQVHAAEGGDVWVLSGQAPYVYRFSRDGTLLQRFGGQGKGPGEMADPWSLVPDAAGEEGIGVWDVGALQLLRYGRRGEFRSSVPVPARGGTVRDDIRDISYGEPFRLRAAGETLIVQVPTGSISHTRDLYTTALVRFGADGSAGDTLLRFDALLPPESRPMGMGLVPIPLWAVCANRQVAVFDPAASRLRWYGEQGELQTTQVSMERRSLTDDDIRSYFRHILELETRSAGQKVSNPEQVVEMMLTRSRSQFGTEAPAAVEMLCDAQNRVWLNAFSTADHPLGYGRDWHVVADGRIAHTVRFPAGFRPAQIGADHVLGIHVDADDVQHPARVPLPKPGSR